MRSPEETEAWIQKIKAEHLEEFYADHPEMRPAALPTTAATIKSFTVASDDDIQQLGKILSDMLQDQPEIEIRLMEAV